MRFPVVSGMPRRAWHVAETLVIACAFVACSSEDGGGPVDPPQPECPDPTPLTLTLPDNFPLLPNPADNPLTVEGVALGRRLFYDPILSADSSLSCGGCHLQSLSFGDSRRFSEGIHGDKSRRQAPTIVNPGWNLRGIFWDGRAAGLEEQATQPVPEPTEMSLPWPDAVAALQAHPEYPDLFCAAFGSSQVTMDRVVKAIAQFERTFVSANSKYDRWKRGEEALTTMEERGFRLFMREGKGDCFHCHDQTLLATGTFHNTGLDTVAIDGGRGEITGNPADYGKFKSPSLRNIMESSPYMHDGRFMTIREVLDHYNRGFRHGKPDTDPVDPQVDALINKRIQFPPMSSAELDTLEAFLETLTDWEFITNPDLSNPFETAAPVANRMRTAR
ncbi:MAG TPA: cytochrome c peroxidase [Candidatus Krumholzibacteria bacterium]|nr:cytochrome c peroxidase [Candidatus Krumholzibacteria bacterium]